MDFRFRPQVLTLRHYRDGDAPRPGRNDASGITSLIGDRFAQNFGGVSCIASFALRAVKLPRVRVPPHPVRDGLCLICYGLHRLVDLLYHDLPDAPHGVGKHRLHLRQRQKFRHVPAPFSRFTLLSMSPRRIRPRRCSSSPRSPPRRPPPSPCSPPSGSSPAWRSSQRQSAW